MHQEALKSTSNSAPCKGNESLLFMFTDVSCTNRRTSLHLSDNLEFQVCLRTTESYSLKGFFKKYFLLQPPGHLYVCICSRVCTWMWVEVNLPEINLWCHFSEPIYFVSETGSPVSLEFTKWYIWIGQWAHLHLWGLGLHLLRPQHPWFGCSTFPWTLTFFQVKGPPCLTFSHRLRLRLGYLYWHGNRFINWPIFSSLYSSYISFNFIICWEGMTYSLTLHLRLIWNTSFSCLNLISTRVRGMIHYEKLHSSFKNACLVRSDKQEKYHVQAWLWI
jgi:hypothetical protein